MDSLWHTVELTEDKLYDAYRPFFYELKSLYDPHFVLDGNGAVITGSPFLRNLHRIRIIKVQYISFLYLFWNQSPAPLEAIPLKEFSVDFEDAPKIPPSECFFNTTAIMPPPKPPTLAEMGIIRQILGRSTRLSKFSFTAPVFQDQARLLASLPPSLVKLDIPLMERPYREEDPGRQAKEALCLFLKMKNGGFFETLTTLSIECMRVNQVLLVALLERAPKLEELNLDGHDSSWNDALLASVVLKVSSKGWKTLGFKGLSGEVGSLTVAAMLKNSPTLKNLRLPTCRAFGSKSIQKLLCSAPNLKRFDTIAGYLHEEMEPYSLMAMDIVAEDWVCLGLETFKCYIGGVPRPEITSMICQ